MQDKLVTYVHDGKEVYLTGRIAKSQSTVVRSQAQQMVEIVPVGADLGDKTYAKWVKTTDLLIITNLEDQEFDDETE